MRQSPLQMLFGGNFDNTKKPSNNVDKKVVGGQSPLYNNTTFFDNESIYNMMEKHALDFTAYIDSLRPLAEPKQ